MLFGGRRDQSDGSPDSLQTVGPEPLTSFYCRRLAILLTQLRHCSTCYYIFLREGWRDNSESIKKKVEMEMIIETLVGSLRWRSGKGGGWLW